MVPLYFMLRDLWGGVGFGFGDVQQARVGLHLEKVSWMCVGVGMALRVVGVLRFLFQCVELRGAGAHSGSDRFRVEDGFHLVGGRWLRRVFPRLLRQRRAPHAGVDGRVVLLLLLLCELLMMMEMMRKDRFLLLHQHHIFNHRCDGPKKTKSTVEDVVHTRVYTETDLRCFTIDVEETFPRALTKEGRANNRKWLFASPQKLK